tara:strand:- start:5600 stop:7978 length:2379 start_codon:yes stop_codon:yes gene_type:complete
MAEKPTNIERASDLIDLDIQSGETVEIEDPTPDDADVAVEFNADGSAELNYFPDEAEEQVPFDANLAEFMDDGQLSGLAMELMGDFEEDRASRQEWEDTYVKGLDLLGFQYEDRDRPFPGASGVTHPMLAEAVTQFQAQAFKELLPSKGPVKAQVMGAATPDVELQASRVQDFMNYQITTEMEEYTPEMDQLLFYLPLAGSAFKKVYYDTMKQRPCSNFVPVDDLVVPYSVSDLNTCERITHIVKMSHNEVRAQQISGAYLDVEIKPSYVSAYDDTQDKEDELEGIDGTSDMMYELLEFHVLMDLPGFEDPDGMHLPYIITVDSTSSKVLSIRRNYRADDPMKQKIQYFVHYKFLPGLGFYGFGLIHMIGGLSRTATAALRQLVDAGTLSNLPAGFKARGLRIRDDETPLEPGEFRDVDAPGGALRDSLIPLPYKEPSGTLFQLLGFCVEAGQRFASVTNLSIGEGNQELPVGTTMALLEQGTRIMSAVHKRLHYAQKTEFKILARLFAETLPPEYPYMVVGGDQSIKQTDFDDRVDVIPVSDPNFFSMSQRISLAQQELQLVQSNPQIHNIKEAYRRMYQALGTENIEALFQPDPPPPMPMDPASENSAMLMGMPATAFPEQDHGTHIEIHLAFLENKYVQANPMAVNAIVSHVLQHVSLMAQGQAEQELQIQMQQNPELAMQLQQQEMMNQQAMAQGQPPMPNAMLENIKAGIELQLMQELMPRLDEILKVDSDPITALKAQELQIRAQENQDDKEIAEKRIEIDEEKIKSQEDIAAMKIQADRERNSGG